MRDSRCGCRADWASACAEWSTSRNCWLKARTARTRYASAETIARRSTTHRNACIGRPRLWHGPPRRHEDAARAPRLAGDRALALAVGLCQDAPRAQPVRMRRADRPIRGRTTVPEYDRHGALQVRRRRVPVLR